MLAGWLDAINRTAKGNAMTNDLSEAIKIVNAHRLAVMPREPNDEMVFLALTATYIADVQEPDKEVIKCYKAMLEAGEVKP